MPSVLSKALIAAAALAPTALSLPTLSKRQSYPASQHCGRQDSINLIGHPWIVYNMMYNADETVGTQCTNFDSITTSSSGTQEVVWSSVTSIDYVSSTSNVPKGYSFVGLTQNLETQLSGIASIPATYSWTRTNTTTFKGNTCFDFMTSDTRGDSTSSAAEEHMLWLQYDGGQLPIGYSAGPVATVNSLYGTSWKLYSGENTDTGITVRSLLPDTQFDGTFDGDIKDWLDALADLGAFTQSTYINVGNAGTEMFYGDAVMNATLGLQINLGTDSSVYSVSSASSAAAVAPATAAAEAATSAATSAASVPASSASVAPVVSSSASISTPLTQPTTVPIPTPESVAPAVSSSVSTPLAHPAPVPAPSAAVSLAPVSPSSAPAPVPAPLSPSPAPAPEPAPASSSTTNAEGEGEAGSDAGSDEDEDTCTS